LPTSLLPKDNLSITDDKLKIRGYWLASGILGVAASTMIRVIHAGADAVVTKSLGSGPRKGHTGPVLTTSHGGLINAVGLTNPGIDAFEEEMKLLNRANIPVIMSIFGDTPQELARIAERAVRMKPSAIELNLSCPHAEISQISHSPNLTYEYVRAVKEAADVPVFAKLTPNASDYVSVGKAAQEAGADAIVAINTVRGMRIDIHQQRPILGNTVGGLSGPPIFPVAVRCVFDLYKALKIPIIGVGGVSSWEDAVELHLAGASAIQIGTAVMNDIEIFSKVKNGVINYIEGRGLDSVDDIIGAGARSEL
jgi:dihydroorotate dehydrogenase (NAD+) catalytic subunit